MSLPNKANFTALILVSGVDRPGITSAVINKLAEFSIDILDIKQIVVGERLLQTILIKLFPDHAEAIEQDLEFLSQEIGADIAIDFDQKNQLSDSKSTAFFMMVEDHLDPKRLSHLTDFIQKSGGNILNMQVEKKSNLTAIIFQAEFVDFDLVTLKQKTKDLALANNLDIYFDTELLNNGDRKLFVFDMDSTLIGQEVIDKLADIAGVSDEVKRLTEDAMSGELDFVKSLTERVGLLSGLTESALFEVAQSITFNPGVIETVSSIKKAGHKVAVVSGGFKEVIQKPLKALSIDYIFANQLEIQNGLLTGKLLGEIMDAHGKANALKTAASDSVISLSNVVELVS